MNEVITLSSDKRMAPTGNHQSSNEEENFLHAMQLSEIIVLPMVLKVAVELDLFEIIGKAGSGAQISPTDVASHLPTQNPGAPRMIDRILRLLASYSILTSSITTREDGRVERLYGLKSVCKYFVRNEDGVSLSPIMLLITDKVFMDSWSHMKDAILEGGIPFNKAHGMHAFEYPETDPRFNQVFNSAMFNHTTILMKEILATYKGFDGLKQVVDVGGGIGTTISLITSKHPTIKGVNFDLPHVIEHAPSYPGVEHVGGDMFDSVPTTEAIFMKWILHDWSDKDCITLLKNCLKALADHGKVIVVEEILPILPETDTAAKVLCHGDLVMLSQNPGGKERTEEEYIALGKEAGFARMDKVCCIYDFWVMELYKTS